MRKNLENIISILFLLLLITVSVSGDSFVNDFLRLDSDIRSAAMGGCGMASRGASGLFGNPAGIGTGSETAFIGHEQLYQGLLISDAAGMEFKIGGPGDFAIGMLYTGGGGIKVTDVPDPSIPVSAQNRPFEVAEKGHHDFALLPGYAMNIGENFRAGISTGLIYRYLADTTAFGGSACVGINWTPVRKLVFGANLKHLSYLSWSTGSSEFGAPTFAIGGRYDSELGAGFAAAICSEAAYSFQEKLIEGCGGIEISYNDFFSLRGGLSDGRITAGADLRVFDRLKVGAALSVHGDLPLSYRIGATIDGGRILETD